MEGFGSYGFPESHAASFALIAYASAWLKCWHPDVFCAALLNSQPMGFYAPAQIVRDAIQHGIDVQPVCINASRWDCTLEPTSDERRFAVRLGMRMVKGLANAHAAAIVAARADQPFASVDDLWRRASIPQKTLVQLADAFRPTLGLARREALWAIKALRDAFLRADLKTRRVTTCAEAMQARDGRWLEAAGLVLVRQRPGSAKGVMFITLEDETGIANLVVWPQVFDRFRRTVIAASMIAVRGRIQREGEVVHLVAHQLTDLSAELATVRSRDADFPLPPGRGHQVTNLRRRSHSWFRN